MTPDNSFFIDLDECEDAKRLSKCSPNANCRNTYGSHSCICQLVYALMSHVVPTLL